MLTIFWSTSEHWIFSHNTSVAYSPKNQSKCPLKTDLRTQCKMTLKTDYISESANCEKKSISNGRGKKRWKPQSKSSQGCIHLQLMAHANNNQVSDLRFWKPKGCVGKSNCLQLQQSCRLFIYLWIRVCRRKRNVPLKRKTAIMVLVYKKVVTDTPWWLNYFVKVTVRNMAKSKRERETDRTKQHSKCKTKIQEMKDKSKRRISS